MQGFKRTGVLVSGFFLVAALAGCPAKTGSQAQGAAAAPMAGSTPLQFKGPKKRVGVVNIENKASYTKKNKRVGGAMVDIVTTELAKTGAFILIERAEMDKVLAEQAQGQSGIINPATAAKTGRILGLQALVIGSLSEFGVEPKVIDLGIFKKKAMVAKATVDVRVVDAETGQILYAESGKGEKQDTKAELAGFGAKGGYDESLEQDAVRAAVVQFMQNLINQLASQDWYGKVAAVNAQEGTATINAGKETGIQVGDKLIVNKLGEVILDPDTQLELGQEVGPVVAEMQVVSYIGANAAKCKIVSGVSNVAKGMRVTMKKETGATP